MTNQPNTDTLAFSESAIEDWQSIFGSAAETNPWWRGIAHITGDWDTPGRVLLTIDNPDAGAQEYLNRLFEPVDILRALAKATELYPWHFVRHGDERYLDLDAESSDVVLQVALFGEVVYG